MGRRCPACRREWDDEAAFCGACGALLGADPRPEHRRRLGRPGRTAVAVTSIAVAVGAAVVVPRVELPSLGGDDVADDGIALPDDARGTVEPADPSPRPTDGPLHCTQDGAPVDCVRWEAPRPADASLGPRVGDVLAEVSAHGLVLRDPGTGEVRWRRPDLYGVRVQAAHGGVLVVVSSAGPARGLDLGDGSDRWTLEAAPVGFPGATPGGNVVLGRASPDGNDVVALAGVAPDTGEVVWEWRPPWGGTLRMARPVLGTGQVVVVGPGRLVAVDGDDGSVRWDVETLEDGYPSVVPPDHVTMQQLGPESSNLWVHDAATGEVVRRTEAGTLIGLVVVDGVVVTHHPGDDEVRAVDLDSGEQLWARPTDVHDGLAGSADPMAATTAVVLHDEVAGTATRLDPRTGEVLWEADVPLGRLTRGSSTFLGRPQLVDDLVVIEDSASIVTVLDVEDGAERVRIDGGAQLDVRSFSPLTLVRDDQWFAVELPPRQ